MHAAIGTENLTSGILEIQVQKMETVSERAKNMMHSSHVRHRKISNGARCMDFTGYVIDLFVFVFNS